MNIHEFYMRMALSEARKAFDEEEVPVGCVIVYNGEVIGRAHNQIKTLKDPTAHAEMIAITQAANSLQNERLNGCDLYVTIEPCSMCVGAMVLARLKTVVYGTSDTKTGACGSAIDLAKPGLFNHNLEVVGGILEEECRHIIQEFFLAKR
ncbi:MAG: tRNA-specific adenosine deaminase [Candidatus Omnitrophica bacterium]|nr:tRNA-specific adenosine deaminase [Candidatus Omnitrophota bacterium]